jgi:hypothetical protein
MVKKMIGSTSSSSNKHEVVDNNSNHYRSMIIDAMRMNQGYVGECLIVDEEPNPNIARFYKLLKDFDEPLWDECTNHSKLLVIAQVFIIKSDHELIEDGYNRIVEYVKSILPERNRLKEKFYDVESMMKPFVL